MRHQATAIHLSATIVLTLAGCKIPHQGFPIGEPVVTSQYVRIETETAAACSLAVSELQRIGGDGRDITKSVGFTLGTKDNKPTLVAVFNRTSPSQGLDDVTFASRWPIIPVSIQIGDSIGAFKHEDESKNAWVNAKDSAIFATSDTTVIARLPRTLRRGQFSITYLIASTRQSERWALPSLERPADQAHLDAFEQCEQNLGFASPSQPR